MMHDLYRAGRILLVRWGDISKMSNIVTLVNHLAEQDFDVTLVTIEGNDQAPGSLDKRVELIGLGINNPDKSNRYFYLIMASFKLKTVLKKRKWDILYVIDSWTLKAVLLANNFSFHKKGTAFVYHSFDWLEPGLHAWPHRLLEAIACRSADLVINTDRARARLQQSLYRLNSTPIHLQNGLSRSVKRHSCDPELRANLLNNCPLENSILLIYPTVAAGPDSFQRMTFELVQAFSLLPLNYHLVTFFQDGEYYQRCSDFVRENRLGSRIKFIRPVPFDQLMGYVACADLGAIFYNDKISSGYFMCNADKLSLFAAYGIPFVASNYPNLEAVVYKHKIGVCCDATYPEQIASAILELTNASLDLAARKRHIEKIFFNSLCFESQAKTYVDALRKLVKNPGH